MIGGKRNVKKTSGEKCGRDAGNSRVIRSPAMTSETVYGMRRYRAMI
jgi:hypothetical protein